MGDPTVKDHVVLPVASVFPVGIHSDVRVQEGAVALFADLAVSCDGACFDSAVEPGLLARRLDAAVVLRRVPDGDHGGYKG